MRRGGWVLVWLLAVPLAASAARVEVTVLDAEGLPLPEAVVYAEPAGEVAPPRDAVLDQVERNFAPHILPIQAGTTVRFPNSDDINHHVYSFAPAKRFELKLTPRNGNEATVLFDRPGLVIVGCNIHDWMLGYILVLETPHFAQTDAQGRLALDLLDGRDYRLTLWHPRIADPTDTLTHPLTGVRMEFRLQRALKPDPRAMAREYR